MTINQLRTECLKIKGVDKVRRASRNDGVFLYYKPLPLSNGTMHTFTDFVHLDTAEMSLERTKMEHERLFK